MAVFGSMNALLGVNNTQWKSGMAEARAEVDKTSAKTKQFFKDINSEWGKKSILGQSLKLAAGGGAIAGITMAANEFEQLTGKVEDLATAYRKGDATGEETFTGMLRQIPVLGKITQGFDHLREAITGEKAAAEKEWAEYESQSIQRQKERLIKTEQETKATKEYAAALRELNQERRLQLAGDDKGPVTSAMKAEDRISGYREELEKSLKNNPLPMPVNTSQLADLRKQAMQTATEAREMENKLGQLNAAQREFKGRTGSDHSGNEEIAKQQIALEAQVNTKRAQLEQQQAAINGIAAQESAYQNAMDKRTEAQRKYDELRGQAIQNAAQDIKDAEAKATADRLKDVEKEMGKRRELQEEAADKELAHRKEIAEEKKKVMDEGKRIMESVRTPQEEFQDQLAYFKKMKDAGAIDVQTLGRASDKALADMMKSSAQPFRDTRVQAEDVMFGKVVTSSDVPQPLTELASTAKEQLVELRKSNGIAANRKVIQIGGNF